MVSHTPLRIPGITKVSTKVLLSFVFIVLFQGVLSVLTLNFFAKRALETALDDQRVKTGTIIEKYFSDIHKEIKVKVDLLAGQAKLTQSLDSRDYYSLRRELLPYMEPLNLDAVLLLDADNGTVISLGNVTAVAAFLRSDISGKMSDETLVTVAGEGNRIQIWALNRVFRDEVPVGTICVAQNLDRSFLGRIEEISNTKMLLTLRKTIPVNGRVSDNVFIEFSRRLSALPETGSSGSIGSAVYRTVSLPGFPDLEVVYFIDTGPGREILTRNIWLTLVILIVALLAAFLIALFLYRFSFQGPFRAFQKAIKNISAGDLSYSVSAVADDEFASLEHAFEEMTRNLRVLETELQIRSRMAAVGEMVAGVAHQIRNPLAVIKVSSEMLRDALSKPGASDSRNEPEKLASLASMIVAETDSLSTVVSRFLDFTRPLKAVVDQVDVRKFLVHAVSLVCSDPEAVSVTVESGAESASFDRHLFEQVVCNLVSNGLDAAGRQGMVSVRAGRDGRGFVLEVADSGPGLSPAARMQLFHPFFTTKKNGTGLGLSIVHRIIQEHGGSVECGSHTPAGTKFTVILPEEKV